MGVLALAAVLTSGQPVMEPQLVQSTTVASTVVDGAVSDLQEAVSISPNRPGASVVLVDVFDTRRPSPGPVREVLVSFLGASGRSQPQRAEQLSDGRWSLATTLADPGSIQVQVLARRSGLPDAARSFAWTIGARGRRPWPPSSRPRRSAASSNRQRPSFCALSSHCGLCCSGCRGCVGVTRRVGAADFGQ